MGIYFDMPAGEAALKEWYDDQKVENLAYKANPYLTMVSKETNATGKVVPIPIVYELSQGISSNFANAQGNQSPALLAEFMVPLRPDYSLATLAHQAALASQDSKGGFLDFATLFIDAALQGSANSTASGTFRSGTGSIGQISSITAGGVITLVNAADVVQFGINQTLQAASTDGGSPRGTLGYVIARNVMAGTVTVSGTALQGPAGQPTNWAANDFLLVQGNSNAKISGLPAWLPTTAPSSTDNYYGVNRSPDSRLYGLPYPGSQQAVEEALIDASMLVAREKGMPRHLFYSYGTEAALIKALGARREFVDWEGEGEIGFRGVKVQGPSGVIECYADRNCQAATGYLVQLDTWKLYSINAVPHIFKWGDGLEMLRVANADAYEVRVGSFANLATRAPGWNSNIAFQV